MIFRSMVGKLTVLGIAGAVAGIGCSSDDTGSAGAGAAPATSSTSAGGSMSSTGGAATGGASYRDFLALAKVMEKLEGGAVMSFGSAVTAPEVYLKALSMVRNVAQQEGKRITHFNTLVCDLAKLPSDMAGEPSKDDPSYYFRPLKTMLIRTVAEGGKGLYVRGDHSETIPNLWSAIHMNEKQGKNEFQQD